MGALPGKKRVLFRMKQDGTAVDIPEPTASFGFFGPPGSVMGPPGPRDHSPHEDTPETIRERKLLDALVDEVMSGNGEHRDPNDPPQLYGPRRSDKS